MIGCVLVVPDRTSTFLHTPHLRSSTETVGGGVAAPACLGTAVGALMSVTLWVHVATKREVNTISFRSVLLDRQTDPGDYDYDS